MDQASRSAGGGACRDQPPRIARRRRDPERLQRLVNRWAESYEEFRAEEIDAATGRTTAELEDQQLQPQTRIDAARAELQAFREANDIVSLGRARTAASPSQRGLNDSLNKGTGVPYRRTCPQDRNRRGDRARRNRWSPNEQKAEIAKLQLGVQRDRRVRLAELRGNAIRRSISIAIRYSRVCPANCTF